MDKRVQERTKKLKEANIALKTEVKVRERAEEALRNSDQQIHTMADSLPVLISYVDKDQRFQFNNALYEKWFLASRKKLKGRHIRDVLGQTAYEAIRGFVKSALSGQKVSFERELIFERVGKRYVHGDYVPQFSPDGTVLGFHALVRDITEFKQEEKRKLETQEHLRRLMETTRVIPWEANAETWIFTYVGPQATKLLGYPVHQWVEKDFWISRLHPEDREDAIDFCLKASMKGQDFDFEYRMISSEGKIVWIHDLVSVEKTEGVPKILRGFMIDITARKEVARKLQDAHEDLEKRVVIRTSELRKANESLNFQILERKNAERKLQNYQEQLRSLASKLSLAEEGERRRIASELHDSIAQRLGLIKIKLGELGELLSPSRCFALMSEIRKITDETISATRSLLFEVSPPVLYDLGFESAVEWLTEQMKKKHGIVCDFKDDQQPKDLEDDIKVVLFQSVRELLANAGKHAKATRMEVSLRTEEDRIRIRIEDDGVGFDTSTVGTHLPATGGFGLFSIRERLDLLGGKFQIHSVPGHGTRATLTAPLKAKRGK